MPEILSIHIERLFYGKRVLLNDLKLKVENGERILVTGITGSGKSSLLSTFNLMNRNYEGEILFEGKNIVEYQPEILRSKICMVLQEPYLEDANVQEVLDLPLHYSSLKHRRLSDRQERIRNLFTSFQLPYEYLKKHTSQLSGGEKQRIALIRVLQLQPDILLLDEITSALDQKTSGIISDCIFNNFAGTVIAISHDPLWQNQWQRNWALENGTIVDRRI